MYVLAKKLRKSKKIGGGEDMIEQLIKRTILELTLNKPLFILSNNFSDEYKIYILELVRDRISKYKNELEKEDPDINVNMTYDEINKMLRDIQIKTDVLIKSESQNYFSNYIIIVCIILICLVCYISFAPKYFPFPNKLDNLHLQIFKK